jgi:hypothetical protein
MRNRTRLTLLAVAVAVCVGAAVAYVGISVARSPRSTSSETRIVGPVTLGPGAAPIQVTHASSVGSRELLFVSMIPDRTAGSLAVAPLSHPGSTRAISALRCERVYYAGGRGICLLRVGGEESGSVLEIFDSKFHVERRLEIAGVPNRARVSRDGRFGATTMFVPAEEDTNERFSTSTSIFDLQTGKEVADLEQVPVTRKGKPFSTDGLEFSAVTFAADDDHYYASAGEGSTAYLLEGSMRDRTLKVIADGADSPSLSPDGTRLAFKRVVGDDGNWRLFVLDLRTMKANRLAGNDPIDDQAEWLDDGHVVYANDNKLWKVAADGSGRPRQILSYAFSPTVIPAS